MLTVKEQAETLHKLVSQEELRSDLNKPNHHHPNTCTKESLLADIFANICSPVSSRGGYTLKYTEKPTLEERDMLPIERLTTNLRDNGLVGLSDLFAVAISNKHRQAMGLSPVGGMTGRRYDVANKSIQILLDALEVNKDILDEYRPHKESGEKNACHNEKLSVLLLTAFSLACQRSYTGAQRLRFIQQNFPEAVLPDSFVRFVEKRK